MKSTTKNTALKVLATVSLLTFSVAYVGKVAAATDSGAGYNAKLVEQVSERGGFNEKSFQSSNGFNDKSQQGGFNDKGLAKDVNPGWKKY